MLPFSEGFSLWRERDFLKIIFKWVLSCFENVAAQDLVGFACLKIGIYGLNGFMSILAQWRQVVMLFFFFFFLNQYSLYTQCFKTCSFLSWPLVYSFLEVFCPASVTVAVQSPRLLVFSVWCLLVNENQKPRTRKLGGLVAVLKASSVSSLLYMATELGYSVFKGVSN